MKMSGCLIGLYQWKHVGKVDIEYDSAYLLNILCVRTNI